MLEHAARGRSAGPPSRASVEPIVEREILTTDRRIYCHWRSGDQPLGSHTLTGSGRGGDPVLGDVESADAVYLTLVTRKPLAVATRPDSRHINPDWTLIPPRLRTLTPPAAGSIFALNSYSRRHTLATLSSSSGAAIGRLFRCRAVKLLTHYRRLRVLPPVVKREYY
jgi:hypothetical protein